MMSHQALTRLKSVRKERKLGTLCLIRWRVFVAAPVFVGLTGFQTLLADCSLTITGNVPLPDLGLALHHGFDGGLYPNGQNSRPDIHEAEGLNRANQRVKPLDANGNLDRTNGKIVLISIGMSNTSMEFSRFVARANVDPSKNPQLVLIDGAQGGRPSTAWTDPGADTWQTLNSRLAANGATPAQVQIAWVKQAQGGSGAFPDNALSLLSDLEEIVRNLKSNYPNIQIAYLSSRTRAYTTSGLSPEPTAYETAFSVKWLIEQQIEDSHGNLGFTVTPWLSWGPYLWADGLSPRSDGFVWACSDTTSFDFTHPSSSGQMKVADQLLAFFKTDPTATPWFLKAPSAEPVIQSVSVTPAGGPVGVTVEFAALASDSDGISEYLWTFDDGTFSSQQNPSKTFATAGDFDVHLSVVDTKGDAAKQTIPVSIFDIETDQPPSAIFSALPQMGDAPLQVFLNGSASWDDEAITSFEWNFGDGSIGIGSTLEHAYLRPGSYVVTLTVTDNVGQTDSAFRTITVTDPTQNDPPIASFIALQGSGLEALTVGFDAHASFDPDGSIVSYSWAFGDGNGGNGPNVTHDYTTGGSYTATLTVEDNQGDTGTTSQTLTLVEPSDSFAVSALLTASGSEYQVVENGLVKGGLLYVDQSFAFSQVAALVEGKTYIKTAIGDRRSKEDPFLTFEVNQDATIYVGHDDQLADPAWLETFQDTGEDLIAGPVTFSLYRKDFPVGAVQLGPNVNTDTGRVKAMYVVVVVPRNPTQNDAPIASFIALRGSGLEALTVGFDAHASFDPDGSIVSYSWAFGDGSGGNGPNVTHDYTTGGSYTATLTVEDNQGDTGTTSQTLTLVEPSDSFAVSALLTASGSEYQVVENGLVKGGLLYVDQSFAFSQVAALVEGKTYIKTAIGDRRSKEDPFLTFEINQDATIYVGHDDQLADPAWLETFQDTGEDLIAGPVTFSLYRKDFPVGAVQLGPNVNTGTSSVQAMYVVVVVPSMEFSMAQLNGVPVRPADI